MLERQVFARSHLKLPERFIVGCLRWLLICFVVNSRIYWHFINSVALGVRGLWKITDARLPIGRLPNFIFSCQDEKEWRNQNGVPLLAMLKILMNFHCLPDTDLFSSTPPFTCIFVWENFLKFLLLPRTGYYLRFRLMDPPVYSYEVPEASYIGCLPREF